jgi:hypothetical protein
MNFQPTGIKYPSRFIKKEWQRKNSNKKNTVKNILDENCHSLQNSLFSG